MFANMSLSQKDQKKKDDAWSMGAGIVDLNFKEQESRKDLPEFLRKEKLSNVPLNQKGDIRFNQGPVQQQQPQGFNLFN